MERAFDLKNNSSAISEKNQINVLEYFQVNFGDWVKPQIRNKEQTVIPILSHKKAMRSLANNFSNSHKKKDNNFYHCSLTVMLSKWIKVKTMTGLFKHHCVLFLFALNRSFTHEYCNCIAAVHWYLQQERSGGTFTNCPLFNVITFWFYSKDTHQLCFLEGKKLLVCNVLFLCLFGNLDI